MAATLRLCDAGKLGHHAGAWLRMLSSVNVCAARPINAFTRSDSPRAGGSFLTHNQQQSRNYTISHSSRTLIFNNHHNIQNSLAGLTFCRYESTGQPGGQEAAQTDSGPKLDQSSPPTSTADQSKNDSSESVSTPPTTLATDTKEDLLSGDVIDLSAFAGGSPQSSLDASAVMDQVSQVLAQELPLREVTTLAWYAYPVGWPLRELLDALHWVGIPWWGTIVISTCLLRAAIFPLYRNLQVISGKMTHIMKRNQEYEVKREEARRAGNMMEMTRYQLKQQELYRINNIKPMAQFYPMVAQSFILISNIRLLNSISTSTLPSLKTGGALWFSDLTGEDPFFALPLITCATLFVSMEVGAESGKAVKTLSPVARTIIRFVPLALGTFMWFWGFPNMILVYFCTNNFISLLQTYLFTIPAVRTKLKLTKPLKFRSEELPKSKKGFVETLKESLENSRIQRKINEEARVADVEFKRAGIGPLKKTYKYDPTKVKPPGQSQGSGQRGPVHAKTR